MRKHKKQNWLLSLTLCMCLVMAFMPVTVFAADLGVTVNKVAVTNANADNVLGDGTVSYDAVKNTLTLKNATIDAEFHSEAISSSKEDLTIILEGNNNIVSDWYGIISTTGTLTFKGEGTLTLSTENDAIRAAEIVVDGTTLNIQQTELCGLYATTDYNSDKGSVSIRNGSNITFGCKDFAIYADGAAGILISESIVTAIGEYDNNVIYAPEVPLSVTNSKVTVENTAQATSPTIWATGISISDNSEVSAKIVGKAPAIYSPATLTVEASSLKAESPVAGVWSDMAMSIEDSTIETMCTDDPATNSLHSMDTISIKGNSNVLAIGGVMGKNGVIVSPSAGNKVDVKVGTKENGETGTKHFKASPYTAAVTFASSDNEELKEYTYVHIKNHTHVYDKQVVSDSYKASNATCTEPAKYYTSCVCGVSSAGTSLEGTFTVGEATGHSFGTDWKFDNTSHWHECTAGDGAKTDIAAHTAGGWIVDKPATENEAGRRHKECTVCKYVMQTEPIAVMLAAKPTATSTADGIPHTVTINSSTIPQTGDTSTPWSWLMLATATLLGCAGSWYVNRKKTNERGCKSSSGAL